MKYLFIGIITAFTIQQSANSMPSMDEMIDLSVGNESALVKGVEWVSIYIMCFLGLLLIVKLITDFLKTLSR